MRKIIISGSAKFYKEAIKWKEKFENDDYDVLNYPQKIDVTNEEEYKQTYENFYQELSKTDDLLLLNLDKNGIEGYIGYESFAELSYLVVKKISDNCDHKIYLYKMPSKEVGCYDEMNHFINLGYIELFK